MSKKETKSGPVSFNVFEEKAKVDKKTVEKGKVRIVKKVVTEDEEVNVSVRRQEVNVERVPVNKYVDKAPGVRYEGNTTIISVVKEVPVVERKILLVEEIRITKKINTTEKKQTIPLRKEKVTVETSRDE